MDDIKQTMKELRETIDEALFYVKAYKYCLESFNGVLEDYNHEIELLEMDLKDGDKSYGAFRKSFELSTKRKLISEVICFMTNALEDAKSGDIE